jgi:hypothetical protein
MYKKTNPIIVTYMYKKTNPIIVTYMYKKTNPIIVKATYILAVQMLIFIGSFY